MPRPPKRGGHFFGGHNIVFALAILFLAFTLKMNNLWKRSQKEKLDAELSYLKAQINPHFLFNTLNSIYSLAIEQSDRTASAIVKLSGMMRYAINEAHQDYVSLQKEISYITDYIDLQRLRMSDSVKIIYTLNVNAVGKQIAPLLLIPFIENAFKFGVSTEEECQLIIHIDVDESHLSLYVKNDKVNEQVEKTGVGILNSKSRLALSHPNKHEPKTQNKEHQFTTTLKVYFV
jgi:LytS/YehU family sensor histidine kinase